MASDVADIHDIDLEVYGTKIDDVTATTTSTITSYNFEVCDSILNVGPCGHVAMGQPSFLSEELQSTTKGTIHILRKHLNSTKLKKKIFFVNTKEEFLFLHFISF